MKYYRKYKFINICVETYKFCCPGVLSGLVSGSKLLTLHGIPERFIFKKVNFEEQKNQLTTNKHAKLPSMQ